VVDVKESAEVHKFGGSCLVRREDLIAIVRRVSDSTSQQVLVVSAFHGVTDRLLNQLDCGEVANIDAFTAAIELTHLEAAPEIASGPWGARFKQTLSTLNSYLRSHSDTPSDSSRAQVLASGERLSSLAVCSMLADNGIRCHPAWSEEVGIHIEGSGEEGVIDVDRLRDDLTFDLESSIPVVTGWYGVSESGDITLLGRGGSDLTATSLAAALDAREVTIWRDVSGVLSLSPRWSLPSRNLSYLSYTEAVELALFSEPMLHPGAVEPLRSLGIPLRLRSLHDDCMDGTRIGPSVLTLSPRVRAVGSLPRLRPLRIELGAAGSVAPTLAQVSETLGKARISVWSLRASPGEALLLVSERASAHAASLLSALPQPPRYEVLPPVTLLSFVGEGVGEDAEVRESIRSAADASDLDLVRLESSEHALRYTVASEQTEQALERLARRLDLLT
jgi:aspartokinase/homoserine dehydrogenase 1